MACNNEIDFNFYLEHYQAQRQGALKMLRYLEESGCERAYEEHEVLVDKIGMFDSFLHTLTILKSLYEVAPNSPYREG